VHGWVVRQCVLLTRHRILDKPVSLEFLRNGTYLAPQQVRLEWDNTALNADSDLGSATMRRGYLFGVKDHPTLPDLDIAEWDTFVIEADEYTVVSINHHLIGQVQALFEAV
jgi:hypothetical protein